MYENGTGYRVLPVKEVWLHHSTTKPPPDNIADEYAAMRLLENIGEQRFGAGISYTFAVMPSGRIYEGHSINRIGTHTKDHNKIGVGIVLVGNYDKIAPPSAMLEAVAKLLVHGKEVGWWGRAALTGGHRDVRATGCPGNQAYSSIPYINFLAADINFLAAGGTPQPSTEDDDLTPEQDSILRHADATSVEALRHAQEANMRAESLQQAHNSVIAAIAGIAEALAAKPIDGDNKKLAEAFRAAADVLESGE